MRYTAAIINHLLEAEDDDDLDLIRDVAREPTEEEARQYKLELEREQRLQQQAKRKEYLRDLVVRARKGDFTGINPEDLKDEPSILPPEYWQAKKSMSILVRHELGSNKRPIDLSPQIRYNCSADPPRLVRKFRKQPTIVAGYEWVWQHLPREVEIFTRYRPLFGKAPHSVNWQRLHAELQARHDQAYNLDDPELTEARR